MVNSTSVLGTELEKVRTKVPVLYDNDAFFYANVEKKEVENISERDMRIPLALRPGGNFGYWDPSDGDLGDGDGPFWDKAVINTVHIKLGIQWTTKAQWGTDSSRKAVINLFRELMAKAMPEFRRQSDNQCMTAGNGVLATVTSASGGGVTNVICKTDGYGVRLLRFGQRVNVYDSTLATNRTAAGPVKITYLDLPTATIKLESAVTGITATDVIVPEGYAAGAVLYGVPYHVSNSTSGTWLGFTRSDTPEILANRVNANTSSLALPYPRLAINLIGDRIGMEQRKGLVAWMHPCQVQAYEQLGQLVSIIQKQAKEENLDMYFDGMRMAGASIKQSYSWDKKRIDFLTNNNWGRAELHPAGFYEVDGRKIFEMRGNSGGVRASQIFYLVASWNLWCDNPAAQAYIDNLTVPTGYIPA